MRNVFLKDILRDLKKSANRFIGMFVIVGLGVFIFAGLGSTGILMRNVGDAYFDEENFMDICVVSTFGLNEKDMEALSGIEGVGEVTGAYSLDAILSANAIQLNAKVHSLDIGVTMYNQINQSRILSGRYPEKGNEALVEPEALSKLGISIGDTIELQSGKNADIRTRLRTNTFRIVGTVQTPLYFSVQRGSSSVGNGQADVFLLIPKENFRQSVYSEAYITVEGARDLFTYGDEYEVLIDSVIDRIEETEAIRLPLRKIETTRQAWSGIAAAKKELELAKANVLSGLTAAEFELDSVRSQISESRLELARTESEIADNMLLIDAQELDLENSLAEIEAAISTLCTSEANLLDQKLNLRNSITELLAVNEELREGKSLVMSQLSQLEASITLLEENLLEIDRQLAETDNAIKDLKTEKKELLAWINSTSDTADSEEILTRLEDVSAQLDDLDTQRDELLATQKELRRQLEKLMAGEAKLNAVFRTLCISRNIYNNQLLQYEAGWRQLDSGIISMRNLVVEMNSQKGEVENGLANIKNVRLEMDVATQTLEKNRRQIADSQNELRVREAAFLQQKDASLAELMAVQASVKESREALYDISDPKWYALNRDTNLGFGGYSVDSDQVSNIGSILPLLFFLVAALVSLTTMTRLVEEQRTSMGTYKALGYSNSKILSKYLLYAVVPSALGALLGGVLGLIAFPNIIMDGAFASIYYIPDFQTDVNTTYLLGGTMLAVLSTAIPTLLTCREELGEVPSSLMRPKAPKVGGKTPLEYIWILWRHLSFLYKVTFRNIFRYKKRLFMTLVGVGGSTALLLTGFGLNDSMSGLVDIQYGSLLHYDMVVSFVDDVTASSLQGTRKSITGNPDILQDMVLREEMIETHMGDGYTEDATMVVADAESLQNFITLRERLGHVPLDLTGEGAIVTEQMVYGFGAVVGSEMVIRDSDDEEFTVTITGICEAYLANGVYMSREYYEEAAGKPLKHNTIYAIKASGVSEEEVEFLSTSILDRNGVSSVTMVETLVKTYKELLSGMSAVIYLIIIIASILAFTVLLNLTNINIAERMREIATIEVLGFRDKETTAYIYRENNIVTFAAALIGIFIGKYLHNTLCYAIEGGGTMLLRNISPLSFILSIAMTMLFAWIVALITGGKLKKINMIEALKSAE